MTGDAVLVDEVLGGLRQAGATDSAAASETAKTQNGIRRIDLRVRVFNLCVRFINSEAPDSRRFSQIAPPSASKAAQLETRGGTPPGLCAAALGGVPSRAARASLLKQPSRFQEQARIGPTLRPRLANSFSYLRFTRSALLISVNSRLNVEPHREYDLPGVSSTRREIEET